MTPVDNVPSAQADSDFGVWVATSTTAPDAYPPSTPASSRSSTKCQTLSAMPMSDMLMAMPRLARISTSLRPYRSAIRPHTGARNPAPRKVMP